MAATLKCDTIQNASSSTANLTLDASGNATVGNTLVMGSSFKRNRLINGNMTVDQRNAGASKTFTAGSTGYTVDRWIMGYATGGSTIVQRVAGPNTYDYALQVQPQTGNTQTNVEQPIEYVNCYGLSGNSVTVSGKVYVDSTSSGSAQLYYYYYPTNGGTQTFGSLGSITLTAGQYVSFSKTFTCPTLYPSIASDTSSRGLGIILEMDNSAGRTFKWTDIQCEVGSIATPYERQIYSEQLAQCQRYCYAIIATNGYAGDIGVGVTTSTSAGIVCVPFPVTPRAIPTGISVTTPGAFSVTTQAAQSAATAITWSSSGYNGARLAVTGTGTPYAINNTFILLCGGGANGLIVFTGSEL